MVGRLDDRGTFEQGYLRLRQLLDRVQRENFPCQSSSLRPLTRRSWRWVSDRRLPALCVPVRITARGAIANHTPRHEPNQSLASTPFTFHPSLRSSMSKSREVLVLDSISAPVKMCLYFFLFDHKSEAIGHFLVYNEMLDFPKSNTMHLKMNIQ